MTRHDFRYRIRRLRFGNNAMILGVCARIADMIDLPAWPLRIAVVIALIFHPVATIALYVLAAILMARGAIRRRSI